MLANKITQVSGVPFYDPSAVYCIPTHHLVFFHHHMLNMLFFSYSYTDVDLWFHFLCTFTSGSWKFL